MSKTSKNQASSAAVNKLRCTRQAARRPVKDKRYKRVQFSESSPSLTVATEAASTLDVTCSDSTWYTEENYNDFLRDCQVSVEMAKRALRDTGRLDEVDPVTILGLEYFLSPVLEQERANRCKRHVQSVLHPVRTKGSTKRQSCCGMAAGLIGLQPNHHYGRRCSV